MSNSRGLPIANCQLPIANPNPWELYQPERRREKEFYDIELRNGVVVMCCYPNGIHWNPWVFEGRYAVPKGIGRGSIADYRVVRIRRTHPDPLEE